MTARVAINGLGRIGRATLKIVLDEPDLELAAVNDIASPDNLAYLLKYDTVYGRYEKTVEVENGSLVIDGKAYRVLSKKDPAALPWRDLEIDVVFECTGVFTRKDDLQKHVRAGAKAAILSAPGRTDSVRWCTG